MRHCAIIETFGRFSLLTLCALALALPHAEYAQANAKKLPTTAQAFLDYEESLKKLSKHVVASAKVNKLSIEREGATFELNGGDIHLVADPAGREFAALYRGEGVFHPPAVSNIERDQFERLTGKDTSSMTFEHLYMIFSDDHALGLREELDFTPRNSKDGIRNRWGKISKLLTNESTKSLPFPLMESLVNGEDNGMFYAGFDTPEDVWYFEINPFVREKVELSRNQYSGTYDYREEVCKFADPQTASSDWRRTGPKVTNYAIDASMDDDLLFAAKAKIDVSSTGVSGPWIYLTMYPDLEVSSVQTADGASLEFVREKNQWRLFVYLGKKLQDGETVTLTVTYGGPIIERDIDWTFIKAPITWYPSSRNFDTANYDLTFHTPVGYRFVSVGDIISADTAENTITSHWKSPYPFDQASFNIGMFEEHTVKDEGAPPVSVLWSKYMHDRLRQALISEGVVFGKEMEKRIAADVSNALMFFQRVFGPCPSESLVVTEIPFDHGQAFHGLLHLSTSTYNTSGDARWDEIFRAHEVAHQWWGFGVGTKSYHDKWMSEGFATFSALWFMQVVYGKNDEYLEELGRWRKRLLERRCDSDKLAGQGAPVWLGYRTGYADHGGDYHLIVYQKGAWILHMLRNIMLNYETMQDDIFLDLMSEFYQTWRGKEPELADFQALVSDISGMDMGWFFEQWVYGASMPTYRFAYQVKQNGAGEYVTQCRVRQERVDPDFKMFVPLKVDFGKDHRPIFLQVFITGVESKFALPPLPQEPKKLEFNALESVLAEVKNESW